MTNKNHLLSIPLDEYEVPPAQLNIESKTRSNLFPWNGQFSPQFVEVMLCSYARPCAKVLDPFCGSGTILAEACRLGMAGTGIELNPAAFILARTYTLATLSLAERSRLTSSVARKLQTVIYNKSLPLIANYSTPAAHTYQDSISALLDDTSGKERVVLESFIILADFFKGLEITRLAKTWKKLRQTIVALPNASASITVHHNDGRYPSSAILHDLVLTSPPYINVYNYHLHYRASAEALGWDLLHIARTEIGSNRKHRSNRFLTVTQYCLDMAIALDSLWTSTSLDARLIFVMGRESRVRGIPFFNGQIVANLAVDVVGYELTLRQERVFINRFGQKIFEDILHLKKSSPKKSERNLLDATRQVASMILENGLTHAKESDVRDDLIDALKRVSEVKESPRYQPKEPQQVKEEEVENAISDPALREAKRHFNQRQIACERQKTHNRSDRKISEVDSRY
jgi:DNA modification methylase